ncbi:MAG: HIT family protein [Candidatus Bipolaricaulota bacterium]
MENCIFCKIVSGSQEALKVVETDHSVAFLDINPLTDGHTVVIPKSHYQHLSDVPDSELADLIQTTQKVNKVVQTAMGADGANIGLNDGEQAGQAIPHTHFHIIPRYTGDGGGSFHSIVNMDTREDLEKVQEQIAVKL